MEFQIQDESNPDIHFFEYKNKKYPFKIEFFQKYISSYPKKGDSDTIPLIDEHSYNDIDLTEESINSFISCVQHEKIQITNDNIVPLNYLAKKYSIIPLIEKTNFYISTEGAKYILIFYLRHQNDIHFKSKAYEDIIEENFLYFIENEQFLDFNFQILYRIFRQYTINHGQIVNSQILDFLIKYLNKFKIQASPLFKFVQFTDDTKSYLDQLMEKELEGVFDTKYLNSSVIRYLYEKSIHKYHVGDVIYTMRDMNDDKSWLECDGRRLDKNQYGQLCSMINPTPDEGKWRHHSIINKFDQFRWFFCNATDGEYFVLVEWGPKMATETILIYSTKNIDDEKWVSQRIDLPDGDLDVDNRMSLCYLNGEFVITILMENNYSKFIFVLHAKNPDEQWMSHLIQIKDLPKFGIGYSMCHCYYLNSTYVIIFRIWKCDDVEAGIIILYGPSFSLLEMNKNFCYKSDKNMCAQIAYGDGKWAISITRQNISNKIWEFLIYASDDIGSLSPDNKDYNSILKWKEGECGFYPDQFVYGGGQWVVVGQNGDDTSNKYFRVYYLQNPLSGQNKIDFEGYNIDAYHNLYYLNGSFYFLAGNKSDHTVHLFYSTDQDLKKENWKSIQVCSENIKFEFGMYNEFSLSCNEQRNILFAVVRRSDYDSKFFTAFYTPGSLYRLPMINPVGGIKAYIKSSE